MSACQLHSRGNARGVRFEPSISQLLLKLSLPPCHNRCPVITRCKIVGRQSDKINTRLISEQYLRGRVLSC